MTPIHVMTPSEFKEYRRELHLQSENHVGLTSTQVSVLERLGRNKRIVGTMRGMCGWNWSWAVPSTDPLPKTLTMNSLIRRNIVWQVTKRRTAEQIDRGEVLFSVDIDDYGI